MKQYHSSWRNQSRCKLHVVGFWLNGIFFLTSWFCKINASKVSVIIKLLLGCQKQCISFANLYMHSLPIKFINAEFTISFCISIFLDIWHRTCTKYALYIYIPDAIYIYMFTFYIHVYSHNKLLVFSSIDTCMCLVFAWSCLFFLFDNILTLKKIIYWF